MGRAKINNLSDMGTKKNKGRASARPGGRSKASKESKGKETTAVKEEPSEAFKGQEGHEVEDVVDLGLDISSSVTGVVLLDSFGKVVKMDFIKLNIAKLTNIFEKADHAKEWFENNLKGYNIRNIYVEANAKMFTAGFSSADTLFTLAKMNALISYLSLKQFPTAKVIDINVTSARSKIGYKNNKLDKRPVKEKVREYVLSKFPEVTVSKHIAKTGKQKGEMVMDAEMADVIDAFVICRGGQQIQK